MVERRVEPVGLQLTRPASKTQVLGFLNTIEIPQNSYSLG